MPRRPARRREAGRCLHLLCEPAHTLPPARWVAHLSAYPLPASQMSAWAPGEDEGPSASHTVLSNWSGSPSRQPLAPPPRSQHMLAAHSERGAVGRKPPSGGEVHARDSSTNQPGKSLLPTRMSHWRLLPRGWKQHWLWCRCRRGPASRARMWSPRCPWGRLPARPHSPPLPRRRLVRFPTSPRGLRSHGASSAVPSASSPSSI